MPLPTKNSILRGLGFVAAGLILVLANRWQLEIKVMGTPTRKAHTFDHLFALWFLKQLLQMLLLPLWKAIDNNWLGLGCLDHGKLEPRAANREQIGHNPVQLFPDGNNEGEERGDQARQPLIVNEVGEEVGNRAGPRGVQQGQRRERKPPTNLVYFPAALFSTAYYLLLYFGIKLTYGSSFIMLKGTVALFTALLALAFLGQQQPWYAWFGVGISTGAFALSGISDYIHVPPGGGYEKYGIAAGDLLIVMAQIMFATKMIYEEKFIRKYSIHPMDFLGREGVLSCIFSGIFLLVFNLVDAVQYSVLPNGRIEDVVDAIHQLGNCWQAPVAFTGSLVFYIVYTYLGLFLIRDHGALPRIMIELFVWTFYWAICLGLKWENFFIVQVPSLVAITIGVLIYSHIIIIPCLCRNPNNDIGLDDEFIGGNADIDEQQLLLGNGNLEGGDEEGPLQEPEGGDEEGPLQEPEGADEPANEDRPANEEGPANENELGNEDEPLLNIEQDHDRVDVDENIRQRMGNAQYGNYDEPMIQL